MNKEEKDINNSNFIETQLPKERTLDVFENSKNRKNYSFVQNNKEILEPLIPSQNDLEKFEEWKKKKREEAYNNIRMSIVRVIIFAFIFIMILLYIEVSFLSVLPICFILFIRITDVLYVILLNKRLFRYSFLGNGILQLFSSSR